MTLFGILVTVALAGLVAGGGLGYGISRLSWDQARSELELQVLALRNELATVAGRRPAAVGARHTAARTGGAR